MKTVVLVVCMSISPVHFAKSILQCVTCELFVPCVVLHPIEIAPCYILVPEPSYKSPRYVYLFLFCNPRIYSCVCVGDFCSLHHLLYLCCAASISWSECCSASQPEMGAKGSVKAASQTPQITPPF